jgi:hypothetical protein
LGVTIQPQKSLCNPSRKQDYYDTSNEGGITMTHQPEEVNSVGGEESKAEEQRIFEIPDEDIGLLLEHVANGMQEKLSDGHFALAYLDALVITRALKAVVKSGGKK